MKNIFLSFKIMLKNSFRTTNCEQTEKLEQMFCPKGEAGGGGGTHSLVSPYPLLKGAYVPPPPAPATTPFFYASANLSCLFFF